MVYFETFCEVSTGVCCEFGVCSVAVSLCDRAYTTGSHSDKMSQYVTKWNTGTFYPCSLIGTLK